MANKSPEAGFELPPFPVSWLKRDVLLFANSIGVKSDELHLLYEHHPAFAAFPTYPIVLPFKRTEQDVIDFYEWSKTSNGGRDIPGSKAPKPDPRRTVDGQRHIIIEKPIPVTSEGRVFEFKTKFLGIYDKGKAGMVTEMESKLVESVDGKEVVYARLVSSSFSVGQGGWGGDKGPKTVNFPPPEGKKPDAVYVQPTSLESALLYRLNGDYNPLHADPTVGAKMKFGGAIMHGLGTWNMTCHAVLRTFCASDPTRLREFQARFASVVLPGDALVVEMWRTGNKVGADGFEEVIFVTKVKESGKVVLSNGRAVVKAVEGSAEQSKL